jgi:SPP1 family predicted phage head-tail adaptor
MQAGELKHQAVIKYDASDGTTDPNWQTLCTVWAKKTGLKGRAYFAAAAAQSENDVMLTIRYRTGINPEMRIILDGDTNNPYRITSEPVDPYDDKMWLELHAQRVDQNGGN